jgi:hypothetical protein
LLIPAEPPAPFDTGKTVHPLLRLCFFLFYLAILAGLAAALVYFAAALFQKGI